LNETELQRVEDDLKRLAPAQPPEDFIARLSTRLAAKTANRREAKAVEPAFSPFIASLRLNLFAGGLLRWVVPMTGVTAILVFWAVAQHRMPGLRSSGSTASTSTLKADDVQIDHELVSTFDAVAKLPTGEPVRFRCREWMDQVVLSDNSRGITIEQRSPRLEIIPVGFDTY
jgi:hypothetical protein